MGPLATLLLTLATEALKAAGDIASAKKVEDILADRPKLSKVETAAFKRALRRLGR